MDVIIDPKLTEYLKLRQDALKRHDPEAMLRLVGLIGAGSEPDAAKKAFELYKRGAARSHPESCYMVGRCYETGTGVRKNYRRAIARYESACDMISSKALMADPTETEEAENRLIRLYLENPEYASCVDKILDACKGPADYDPQELLEAAMSGDAKSQYILGCRLQSGRNDFEKDIKKAEYWLIKSAEQGNDSAIYTLAKMYKEQERLKDAAEWYRKYAETQIEWWEKRNGR